MTAAHILGLKLAKRGDLVGRVLSETIKTGANDLPQVKRDAALATSRQRTSDCAPIAGRGRSTCISMPLDFPAAPLA